MGEKFSPEMFARMSSVKLIHPNEPGAIGHTGRYKGKPIPEGAAYIEVSDKAEADWLHFDRLLCMLEGCIVALWESGAEDVRLSCSLFHDGQCNFGFSKEDLRRIADLKVDFSISCYSDDLLSECEK